VKALDTFQEFRDMQQCSETDIILCFHIDSAVTVIRCYNCTLCVCVCVCVCVSVSE